MPFREENKTTYNIDIRRKTTSNIYKYEFNKINSPYPSSKCQLVE